LTTEGLSYAAAGVDVGAYERMLERVKPLIAATHGDAVATGVGPFAGLYAVPGGHLAASADGVGTKIKVAVAYGRHRGIGHDLVNHCVNDIATAGARPLFFLDYFAAGRLEEEVFTEVMAGLTESCRANGCALLGGETAEMPGVYALGDYDLAGFIVGWVDADAAVRPAVTAGDVLVGLPSSGLHTNGFSLVRQVFEGVDLGSVLPELGRPLGEELLEPHRSYLHELQALPWKAAAHVTGGGLLGNLPRALPEGLAAHLDRGSWRVPDVFRLIAARGRLEEQEMLGTFNLGVGMVLVCAEPVPGYPVIGRVVEQSGPERVTIG
jgi:phosphoribosylformylglycinamidine cyclo-ligase